MSLTERQQMRKSDLEHYVEELDVWIAQEETRIGTCDRKIDKYRADREGLDALIELEKKQKEIIIHGGSGTILLMQDAEKELEELRRLENDDPESDRQSDRTGSSGDRDDHPDG